MHNQRQVLVMLQVKWLMLMDTPKPLGYWLQHLHNLLETHFTLVLADLVSNRREWQLLSTLTGGPRSRTDLERALAPFWTGGGPSLRQVLANLRPAVGSKSRTARSP